MTKNPICEPISPTTAHMLQRPKRYCWKKSRGTTKRNKTLRIKPSHKELH